MDPITAFGVAANIVQLLAIGVHISKRIKDFSSSHLELPEALRDVAAKLNLLNDVLGRIKREIDRRPDAFSAASIRSLNGVINGTTERTQRLATILDRIAPVEDDSSLMKVKKALLSIAKDDEVADIASKLTQDVIFLTVHQVTPAAHPINYTGQTEAASRHLQGRTFYDVPHRRVQEFVGREDLLSQLKHALTRDSDIQPRIAVLQGMGGQGKTQIALEHCRRAKKDRTYSAIFWADASSEQSLRKSFEGISEHLRAPGQVLVDTEARVTCAKSILSEWSQPWLLIFDNYDNLEDFPALTMANYVPSGENCAILFTSRTPHAHRLGRLIHVSGMSEEEAVKLLLRRVSLEPNHENVSQAENIVRRLGYLPLAIDQAGAYLNERLNILPLNRFLDYYQKHTDDILTSTPGIWEYFDQPGKNQEHNAKTVFTTWNMSFNLLKLDTERGQRKAALLDVLAFFDEKDISEEIFSVFNETIEPCETKPAFMYLFTDADHKWQKKWFEDVLIELKSLSLISSVSRDPGNYLHVSLHPLIRDWVRLRQTEDRVLHNCLTASTLLYHCLKGFDIGHLGILTECSFRMPLKKRSEYLTHLSVWNRNFFSLMAPHEAKLDIYCSRSRRRELELCFAHFFLDCTLLHQSQSLYQWLWDHTSVNDNVQLEAKSFAGEKLLETLAFLGEYDDMERKAKEIAANWQALLEDNHHITNKSLCDMAAALNFQGKFGEAEVICRKHVDTAGERTYSEAAEHHFILVELIEALRSQPSKHKWEEAKALSRKLLDDNGITPEIQVLPYFWNVRQWMIIIGLQDTQHQIALSRSLVDTMEVAFGTDHTRVLNARAGLSSVLLRAGYHEEAEYITRRCISDSKYHYPWGHNDLENHVLLADVLAKQQKFAEAEEVLTKGLEIRELILERRRKPDSNFVWGLSGVCSEMPRLKDRGGVSLELAGPGGRATVDAELVSCKIQLAIYKRCQAISQKKEEAIEILMNVLEYLAAESNMISHAVAENTDDNEADATYEDEIPLPTPDPWVAQGRYYSWQIKLHLACAYADIQMYEDADTQYREAVQIFSYLQGEPVEDSVAYAVHMVHNLASNSYQTDGTNLDRAIEYSEWANTESLNCLGEANELAAQCGETVQKLQALRNDLLREIGCKGSSTLSNDSLSPLPSTPTHPQRPPWFSRLILNRKSNTTERVRHLWRRATPAPPSR